MTIRTLLPFFAIMASVPEQQKVSSSGCGVNSRMVLPRIDSTRGWAAIGNGAALMYNSAAMRVVSFIFLLAVPLAAQEYRAGVSRIDITPPVGHAMGGYTARKGNAAGTHDPLYATVLVLESGGTRLALVTADLRSFVSTRVGQLAKERFGVQHTIISVSHTHSGPLTWEARTPWYTEAEDGVGIRHRRGR